MKPQSKKLMTGLAGEYLVAGMMSMRGWVASLTLKNYPGVDIFGMRPENNSNEVVNIQVKTTRDNTFWVGLMHSDMKTIRDHIKGPYVFVHLPKEDECEQSVLDLSSVDFYILSKSQVIEIIQTTDEAYQKKDRGNRQLKEDYSVALLLKRDYELLAPFKDQWDNLWEK